VGPFILEALSNGVLVDPRLEAVTLRDGSDKSAYVITARRGAGSICELDQMKYYRLE